MLGPTGREIARAHLEIAQLAGLERIPAIVRRTGDDILLRDALLENIHRVQLNPLEEAAAYQQLLEDFGVTQEELAARLQQFLETTPQDAAEAQADLQAARALLAEVAIERAALAHAGSPAELRGLPPATVGERFLAGAERAGEDLGEPGAGLGRCLRGGVCFGCGGIGPGLGRNQVQGEHDGAGRTAQQRRVDGE